MCRSPIQNITSSQISVEKRTEIIYGAVLQLKYGADCQAACSHSVNVCTHVPNYPKQSENAERTLKFHLRL